MRLTLWHACVALCQLLGPAPSATLKRTTFTSGMSLASGCRNGLSATSTSSSTFTGNTDCQIIVMPMVPHHFLTAVVGFWRVWLLVLLRLMCCPPCLSAVSWQCRGTEHTSINSFKSKRDYLLTIANINVIGAEDKPDVVQFDQAVRDLSAKHAGSNAALYGRLSYIILIATAGPYMKVFAMPITPKAHLRLIVDRTEVCAYATGVCSCVALVNMWQNS